MHLSGDLGDLTIYQTKTGRIVAFPRSPPHKPPSPAQNTQRYRFRQSVEAWHELPAVDRLRYETACKRLSLCMSGFNLWIHFCLVHDWQTLATLRQQSTLNLATPPEL